MMKILIAGIGNVLRGDDGFGIRVLEALSKDARVTAGVDLYEAGIAGIGLVQELINGYDALITTLGWRRAGGRRRAGRCFQPPPAKLMGFNKQQTIYWTAFWPVQYDSTISLVFSIWFQQHYQFRFKTRTRRCFPDSEDNAFAGLLPSDPTFQPIPY